VGDALGFHVLAETLSTQADLILTNAVVRHSTPSNTRPPSFPSQHGASKSRCAVLYFLIPLTMLSCIAALASFLSWRAWLKWTDRHLPKTLTLEEFERIAPIVSGPFPRWCHPTDLFRQIIDRDGRRCPQPGKLVDRGRTAPPATEERLSAAAGGSSVRTDCTKKPMLAHDGVLLGRRQ
jgi:hypothetical protein